MGPKVVFGDNIHGDSHPAFYEGNHGDNYLSLFPICVLLSLFAVTSASPGGILYVTLKFAIPSLKSTKLLNIHF